MIFGINNIGGYSVISSHADIAANTYNTGVTYVCTH